VSPSSVDTPVIPSPRKEWDEAPGSWNNNANNARSANRNNNNPTNRNNTGVRLARGLRPARRAFSGSVVIGIIDTGVSPTHPELVGRLLVGRDFVNGDADPADDHGHGAHVAGIAAAPSDASGVTGVTGVAWRSDLQILPDRDRGAGGPR
jgi:subtilisin family serine protease